MHGQLVLRPWYEDKQGRVLCVVGPDSPLIHGPGRLNLPHHRCTLAYILKIAAKAEAAEMSPLFVVAASRYSSPLLVHHVIPLWAIARSQISEQQRAQSPHLIRCTVNKAPRNQVSQIPNE